MPSAGAIDCFIAHLPSEVRFQEYEKLDEPQDFVGRTPIITRYIVSEPDTRFTINFHASNTSGARGQFNTGLDVPVEYLGIQPTIDDLVLPKEHYALAVYRLPSTRRITGARGVIGGAEEEGICGFEFSKMVVLDEDEEGEEGEEMSPEKVRMQGEIVLKVLRFRHLPNMQGRPAPIVPLEKGGIISEKIGKGKGLDHVVSLTEPEDVPRVPEVSGEYLDTEDDPFLVFRFRYRTRAQLQYMGLIPSSPSPSPRKPVIKKEEVRVKKETRDGWRKRGKDTRVVIDLTED